MISCDTYLFRLPLHSSKHASHAAQVPRGNLAKIPSPSNVFFIEAYIGLCFLKNSVQRLPNQKSRFFFHFGNFGSAEAFQTLILPRPHQKALRIDATHVLCAAPGRNWPTRTTRTTTISLRQCKYCKSLEGW